MYICIHVCILHACMYVRMYACIYVGMYACMYVGMYAYVHACIYIYIYTDVRCFIHAFMCSCSCFCGESLTRSRPAAATGVSGFMVSRYDMVYTII